MKQCFGGSHKATLLGALVGVLATICAFASSAGAVVVRLPHGQVAGVTPVRGVSSASFPGSVARRGAGTAADNGTLNYGKGVVLHGVAPYLIFWDPNNELSATDKALFERFFADSAADSGKATNVYSVARQYTDTTGFANYSQTWAASQAIVDNQPYPATGQCAPAFSYGETTCLYDSQLQAEVARVVAAQGLPTGVTGNAPIYFVITPPSVDSCFDNNSSCADDANAQSGFCAYHSSFTDGSSTVLYSNIPTVLAVNNPKTCQVDNSQFVQSPNNDQLADVAIKYMSHEFNETITDPVKGGGWYDHMSGQENGDECNFYAAAPDPAGGSSPNAYVPVLGGSDNAGTLFNQLMNGNPYYTQSEWSNGDLNCDMRSTPSALSAAFTAPASASPGTAVSFDPSPSSSSAGYSSTTWNYGDGTTSFAPTGPAGVSHGYGAIGTYTATLTLVDTLGNLSTSSQTVTVHGPEAAAFGVSSAQPGSAGSPVSFDGSGSNDPGASLSSYSWNFGDGSAAGSGATTSHTYPAAGVYTVSLTVTDNVGAAATTSHPVTVVGVPSASLTVRTRHPAARAAVSFDGSRSSDTGSSIVSYRWSFGRGATATGAKPKHTFRKIGTYAVSLTVTDASGASTTVTSKVKVRAPSITKVSVKKGKKVELIKLQISGPGTLSVGSERKHIRRAQTVTLKVTLSGVARAILQNTHRLTLRVSFKFKPVTGRTSHKTVTIKLKG